jgi:hypothetical protein
MPQPILSGNHRICKFGGLALPNGQGIMLPLDLNDLVSWYMQDEFLADLTQQLTLAQMAWMAQGVYLGADFGPVQLRLPMEYREAVRPLGAAVAVLAAAGEQQLTFDNATYIPVRFQAISGRRSSTRMPSILRWTFDLVLTCKDPWFRDFATSNVASTALVNAPTAAPSGAVAAGGALATGTYTLSYTYVTASGETAASPASANIVLTTGNQQITVSAVTPLPGFATAVKWYFATGPTTGFTVQNSGAGFTLNTAGNGTAAPAATPPTQFSVVYAGSVFTRPVWTLTIPSSNAAPIASFRLQNLMNGDDLTVAFPGNLPANTAATVTIDSGVLSVVDGNGVSYDVSGVSFPLLYASGVPGQAQAQQMRATLTPASGTPTGCTISASYLNRWLL